MISLDYVKHLKYKRCVGKADKNVRSAKKTLKITKQALEARVEEYRARHQKERLEEIIKHLLIYKSFSLNTDSIGSRFKKVSDLLKQYESAVEAERAAFATVRKICSEFSKNFEKSYTNWEVRHAAITSGMVTEDVVKKDTVRVKVCGQIDILSSGAIKRKIRESFFTLPPDEAFERTGIIMKFLRSSRDAA